MTKSSEGSLVRPLTRADWAELLAAVVLALWAAVLCWKNVSWALQPGLFPIFDELSTRTVFLTSSYRQLIHFFPNIFYADRPVGWAFIRLLADLFGFDYTKQVACLLAIHFANCGLAFLLFRRLGAGIPISIAGMALFGSLATTAQTATYVGESFDVICLFLLLGSTVAILWERWIATILSALLFLAALRTKEFAIVTPVLLTVLVALRLPDMPAWRALAALARRLWLHYLILLVFGLRYFSLFGKFHASLPHDNPYYMDLHVGTALKSLAYYTALVFGADEAHWQLPPVPFAVVLGAILCWAVFRRRAGVALGVCAYVLTLLPVCLLPNMRAPYWVYAPQLFLILALGLLAEEVIGILGKREQLRQAAAVCLAIVCLWWCGAFERSPYSKSRVSWTLGLRRTFMRSARDVDAQFPPMGPETHVYVNHKPDATPWLFLTGPCNYLKLVNQQQHIFCVVDQPAAQLRSSYTNDTGPKFFVDYHDDGSITVTDRAGPAAAPNH
jgi:hypothetical protein